VDSEDGVLPGVLAATFQRAREARLDLSPDALAQGPAPEPPER
jgi:hypothetical protein